MFPLKKLYRRKPKYEKNGVFDCKSFPMLGHYHINNLDIRLRVSTHRPRSWISIISNLRLLPKLKKAI